jgi:hypothetical protein
MKKSEKKIFDLGFVMSKPNLISVIILSLCLFIELMLIFIKQPFQEKYALKNLDALFFVFAWFSLLTTPLVEWLRNIYVLIGWFCICIIWFYYKVEQDMLATFLPLGVLVYSQISRLIFRRIMGYHPIHLIFNQYASHRYSAINKRKSTKIDYRYSMIYSVMGLVLTILIGIINIKK